MDHKDLCEHTRIRLIAAAVGHQQCTKTASNIIHIPGGDRVIAIGTPAQVRALLPEQNNECECGANAWCDFYTGPVKTHDICAMCDRKRPARSDDGLRLAVREMAAALEAREWAEHVSRDPDAAAIELQITDLVGQHATLLSQRSGAPIDAMSDDDLWHIAIIVTRLNGGALFNVSAYDCVTAIRASFLDPDSGRQYEQARAAALEGDAS
jgi:hypothetical protein